MVTSVWAFEMFLSHPPSFPPFSSLLLLLFITLHPLLSVLESTFLQKFGVCRLDKLCSRVDKYISAEALQLTPLKKN